MNSKFISELTDDWWFLIQLSGEHQKQVEAGLGYLAVGSQEERLELSWRIRRLFNFLVLHFLKYETEP